jgi:GGDEF domain-containing protein
MNVTASIGVAEGHNLDDLLRRADRAMYVVKHSGKGGWGIDAGASLPEVS